MRTLSVSQLKARLSEQLRHVRAGESVVVTDRGAPVAILAPIQRGEVGVMMKQLVDAGAVRPPRHELPNDFFERPRPVDPGATVREAVADERRTGW